MGTYECVFIECCVDEVSCLSCVMCDVCMAIVCVCGDESMCGALRKGLQWAMETPGRQKGHIQMANNSSDDKLMMLS